MTRKSQAVKQYAEEHGLPHYDPANIGDSWGFEKDVYLRLIKHIEDTLKDYPEDGTREEKYQFYSDLDISYQQNWIMDALLQRLTHQRIILTGQFGRALLQRMKDLDLRIDYILYNGGIRHGAEPVIEEEKSFGRILYEDWNIQDWWMVDDSYYSGRTKFIISVELAKRTDYKITNTLVIYDGSSGWNPQVNAIYKWYMIHGLQS